MSLFHFIIFLCFIFKLFALSLQLCRPHVTARQRTYRKMAHPVHFRITQSYYRDMPEVPVLWLTKPLTDFRVCCMIWSILVPITLIMAIAQFYFGYEVSASISAYIERILIPRFYPKILIKVRCKNFCRLAFFSSLSFHNRFIVIFTLGAGYCLQDTSVFRIYRIAVLYLCILDQMLQL